jgi:hypothetical protein
MALKLNIDICAKNCKYFQFTELTGAYNALTNLTGWETPNPAVGSATSAILTITDPDGTETEIDLLATSVFPNSTDSGINIVNTQLGYLKADKLNTGIWEFLYTVITPTGTYTKTKKIIVACKIECEIETLKLQLINNCNKEDKLELSNKIQELEMLLMAAEAAADCGNIVQAQTLIDSLEDFVANNDCNCS